ncbi:MAG: hypothetical protein GF401_01105 [Chitinivibrionales bacterium]|nr:hypothetical protein [Chitinivibrionales bacterium]
MEDWERQRTNLIVTYGCGNRNPRPSWMSEQEYESQAFHPEALIKDSDRDAADVVLRRTQALLNDIKTLPGAPDLSSQESELDQLKGRNGSTPISDADGRKQLYVDACTLRREIAFKNPLLDFNSLVFLKRHTSTTNIQKSTPAMGSRSGGGIFRLDNIFGNTPTETNLLNNSQVSNGRLQGRTLEPGNFRGLELSYDASTMYFSYAEYTQTEVNPWNSCNDVNVNCEPKFFAYDRGKPWNDSLHQITFGIFKASVDGNDLVHLTDSPFDDQDPFEMPDGRIGFLSGRRESAARCNGYLLNYGSNLFSMKSDGSDIIQLSYHETHEWEPSIDNNGMIVYARWDYVDRNEQCAHNLWTCYPDGRDPRAYHGNYWFDGDPKKCIRWPSTAEITTSNNRPSGERYIRAIPGSNKYLVTAVYHDEGLWGSLMIADLSIPDDGMMSQLKRVTPDCVPLSNQYLSYLGNCASPMPEAAYGTPWPLNENYYICAYAQYPMDYTQNSYSKIYNCRPGLYLVDCFGNKELLFEDPDFPCIDPIPLKSRPRPPAIASRTYQGERAEMADHKRATISIVNVYESDFEWLADVNITHLRITQLVPWDKKTGNDFAQPDHIGYPKFCTPRMVLGTVPVEEDGSVYFEAPVGRAIFFQALNEDGLAVQSMRSCTFVHPGEQLSCSGCHEDKWKAIPPPAQTPRAFQRPPSSITPDVDGSCPVSFPRLVQPVLDSKCQPCHEKESAAPDLSSEL